MSQLKIALIFALVIVSASGGKSKQRGRRFHQRGREMEAAVAEAGASPDAEQDHAQIGDALNLAMEQNEILSSPDSISPSDAAVASAALQASLTDAIGVAAQTPQAQEVQGEVVAQKVEETHDDLDHAIKMAKKHQKALAKWGADMSPEEAVEHHKALQKYLQLALHFVEQHNIAVQEHSAIQEGAAPEEVAEIAPAVISGRSMKGRSVRGRSAKKGRSARG